MARDKLRTGWIWLFLPYLGIVILGTLVIRGRSPYEWIHLLIPPGRLQELLVYPLQHHNPVTFTKLFMLADTAINLLLFFPLGMALFLALQRFFPDGIRTTLVIVMFVSFFLSSGIELMQAQIPQRISSASDVVANTGGAVFGCYFLCFRKLRREYTR